MPYCWHYAGTPDLPPISSHLRSFLSLPQKHHDSGDDDRTSEQYANFKAGLASMYTVYACARVIIIESVPSDARNPMPYQDRGWCFFEATISIMCGSLVLFDEYFSDRKWQMLQLKLKALGGVATSEAKELDVFCAAWNKELNKKMFVNDADKTEVANLFKKSLGDLLQGPTGYTRLQLSPL